MLTSDIAINSAGQVSNSNSNTSNKVYGKEKTAIENGFKECVSQLKSGLNKNSIYVPWIKVTIGNFVIDTSSKKDNIFLSVTHARNGSGCANQCTITLVYIPVAEMSMTHKDLDVNFIDRVLVCTTEGTKITYQYGYNYPFDNLKSPEYELMISKYNIEIQDGKLLYTIQAISSTILYRDIKGSSDPVENIKPTIHCINMFNKYLKPRGYTIEFAEDTQDTDNEENFESVSNVNIFEYMNTILQSASYSEDTDDTPECDRSTYIYVFDDKKDDHNLIIKRLDPTKDRSDCEVVFNWMNGEDDIVLDFRTEFNGLISTSTYAKEFSPNNKYGLDEVSNRIPYYGVISPTTGPKTEQDAKNENALWAELTTYAYKATLTTIGIPVHIPILTCFKIVPLIYGQAHHTQGIYQVISVTDSIDSSGFTTSFELIKCNSSEIKEFYKDESKNKVIEEAKAAGLYESNKKQIVKGSSLGTINGSYIYSNATGLAEKIIQVASAEVGYKESGTNITKYGTWFGMQDMWCHIFVSWCANQAGIPTSSIPKTASCATGANFFKSRGKWQNKGIIPKPGYIIYFKSGSRGNWTNHVGIVTACNGTSVFTIEGNSNDMVASRMYDINSSKIVGYGAWC